MAQGAGVATQAETGDARTLTDRLLAFTGRYTSAAVAFSGGLDSTLVLWACKQALGDENTLAITSNSPSFPSAEAAEVERIVAHIGLDVSRQRFISTREMEVAGYYENNSRRCYYCKTELYREVDEVRQSEGIEVVFDGANLSDLGDFRPGQEAAREYGVVSPLLECSIDKPTARRIAKTIGLPVADKPASACLSSRIPRGVRITDDVLRQIDRAEASLKAFGFSGFRVRYHQEMARLELSETDTRRLYDDSLRRQVIAAVKNSGFRFVTLDLEGYRMGSLNPINSGADRK